MRDFAMQKWECLTVFVRANIDNPGAQELVGNMYRGNQTPIFAPESMVPDLNW
jgi:hypothetical protein